MKSFRKTVFFLLTGLLLCAATGSAFAAGLDTPFIPVPDENEEIYVAPFYYSFDPDTEEASVVDYGGWNSHVVIPETVEYEGTTYTVTTIGADAFRGDNTILSLTLSKNVDTVEKNAFYSATELSDVWYEGSESDKSGISVSSTGNKKLTDATWHYQACIHNPADQKIHVYDNACDTQCNYCDLIRTVSDHVFDGDSDITCNECGWMRIVPGDVDEDNAVTIDDALHLLNHYFFPEYYTINVHHNVDYDRDSDLDLDDVFYLLYHVYFPERFPIEIVD